MGFSFLPDRGLEIGLTCAHRADCQSIDTICPRDTYPTGICTLPCLFTKKEVFFLYLPIS